MKLGLSHSAARASAFAAVTARVFLGMSVDAPAARTGAWLSTLLGIVPTLFWVLCLHKVGRGWRKLRRWSQIAVCLALMIAALADCSAVIAAVARSSGYLALDRIPAHLLAIPVCLAALWCVCRNGDAIGYGAMLGIRVMALEFALIILLQSRHYRPTWLLPLLDDGWRGLSEGALRSAGWCVVPSSLLLLSEPEPGKSHPWNALSPIIFGMCAASLSLALCQMMTPVQLDDGGWLGRLDAVLTNGRAPLYLQLPMISMWYLALLHLCSCECFAASAFLQRLAPSVDGRLCALLAVSAVAMLYALGLPGTTRLTELLRWQFVVAAALIGIAALSVKETDGGSPCAL